MSTLVLHYHLAPQDWIQLTAFVRDAGHAETPLATVPQICRYQELLALSRQIQNALADAFAVIFTNVGQLDLSAARGHLERLRSIGTDLRRMVLPDKVNQHLQGEVTLEHVAFRHDPQFIPVPFELMFWGDFVCCRYAVGRELLSANQASPKPAVARPAGPLPFKAFSIVDPGRLLLAAGAAHLPKILEELREAWDRSAHHSGRPFREFVNLDAVRAFRPVEKKHVIEALRFHDIVNFVCHHFYDLVHPGRSGFVLDQSAGGRTVFTAEEFCGCLEGESPPRLLFTVACASGLAAEWDREWIQDQRVYGLLDAVLRCGIRHFVGTVVQIPAERSPELLLPFYQKLVLGYTIGQALREARLSFRRNHDNPLDGNGVLGLAFVLYGVPAQSYLCAAGHRTDTAKTVFCTVCGRVVCPREPDFATDRCEIHGKMPLTCSAGHPVTAPSRLVLCVREGCRNTVCPRCSGWGQQLCWEHCCFEGHPIIHGVRKTCPNPSGLHPGEKRSVCPHDTGWNRGLDDECLRAVAGSPGPPACPHDGRFIDDNPQSAHHNPWAGTCDHGTATPVAVPLCAKCQEWRDQTMYCPQTNRPQADKDADWVFQLTHRGRDDTGLVTLSRLETNKAIADDFQAGVADNLNQVRLGEKMPLLRPALVQVLGPHPWVCGVRKSIANLSDAFATHLQTSWQLPPVRNEPHRPWRPPPVWLNKYKQANELHVHELKCIFGSSLLVAVATITPVAFEPNRGPILAEAIAAHLGAAEEALREWHQDARRKPLPDVFLVVCSAGGWAERVRDIDPPGFLTVCAEPRGSTWKMILPPLDGKPEHVKKFVELLCPETVWRRKQQTREKIESVLTVEDYVTVLQVQDALLQDFGHRLSEAEVLDCFRHLAGTGRYVQFDLLDGQTALRVATPAERSKHVWRRRWRDRLAVFVEILAAALAIMWYWYRNPTLAVGSLAVGIGCYLLNRFFSKLAAYLQRPC